MWGRLYGFHVLVVLDDHYDHYYSCSCNETLLLHDPFSLFHVQRWIYRVDKARVNEFGWAGDATAAEAIQETDDGETEYYSYLQDG